MTGNVKRNNFGGGPMKIPVVMNRKEAGKGQINFRDENSG